MSPNGQKLLMEWEGVKLYIYKDTNGHPTIGVGHLICRGEDFSKGITTRQALDLLANDLERFERCVTVNVHAPLNQHQFDALVSFAFNEGCGAFGASTLLIKLNQLDYDSVPEELMHWTRSGHNPTALVGRRQNEIKLWNNET
jgi:GH24 family phage-related lysozyme (muramidase)